MTKQDRSDNVNACLMKILSVNEDDWKINKQGHDLNYCLNIAVLVCSAIILNVAEEVTV